MKNSNIFSNNYQIHTSFRFILPKNSLDNLSPEQIKINNKDLKDNMEDFYFLLKHLVLIIKEAKGTTLDKDEEWLIDAEKIAIKYTSNMLSIADLTEGTKPKIPDLNLNINFYDPFSIAATARSAFESYLTFHYIFVDRSTPKEERKFRYDLWSLSNLINRQRYTELTKKIADTKTKEKKQIKTLLKKIKGSIYFKKGSNSISEKAYTKILKNDLKLIDWKPNGSWLTLAKIAKIDEGFFNDAYNLLSSVSHTDKYVAIYLENIYSDNKNKISNKNFQMIESYISILNVITAIFINDYSLIFEKAKSYIARENALKEKISILSYLKSSAYSQK